MLDFSVFATALYRCLVLWEKHALMTVQPTVGQYVPYFSL